GHEIGHGDPGRRDGARTLRGRVDCGDDAGDVGWQKIVVHRVGSVSVESVMHRPGAIGGGSRVTRLGSAARDQGRTAKVTKWLFVLEPFAGDTGARKWGWPPKRTVQRNACRP